MRFVIIQRFYDADDFYSVGNKTLII